MRKIIMSGLFAIAVVGLAFAADRDRHADFTKAPNTAPGCKGFYGSDDNLTACSDFCGQFRSDNPGATCDCNDGKCPADGG